MNYSINHTKSPFAELDTVTVLMPLPFQGGQLKSKSPCQKFRLFAKQ